MFRSLYQYATAAWNTLPLVCLERTVIRVNDIREVNRIFRWHHDPLLDRSDIYDFEYIEDVNERRIRDAECLATVAANVSARTVLEIGTASGRATTLLALNAPDASIYTVNISPEEIASGQGGKLTTIALEREKIGAEFRRRNLTNITQIYANTATWEPDIGMIDIAFIDGCHDADFVFNDTVKILRHMRPGGFILWHDFNPDLVQQYHWIRCVCRGLERLCRKGYIRGRIIHVRDSWTGIYQVPFN